MIRDHELVFYDRYLKDEANGWDERPPLELFVLGANEWRGEHEWPLARHGADAVVYLRQGGDARRADEPRADEPADRYSYDPHDPVPTIGGVNSVLTMTQGAQTPVRPGPARPARARGARRRARLHERAARPRPRGDRPGRDGALRRVERAGTPTSSCGSATSTRTASSIFLTEGIIRARYRNSHEGDSTELLEPDEVAEYRIRCYPLANVFKAGHRLRLDVTSSSFPRFSRNLNTGEDVGTGTRMEVARQTVLHTSVYPSHVVLPVIPR